MHSETLTNKAIELVASGKHNHYERLLHFASGYIKTVTTFTSEDLIEAYNNNGFEQPKEHRVWGAVTRMLSKQNLIKGIDWVRYRKPEGHGKPSRLWLVCG